MVKLFNNAQSFARAEFLQQVISNPYCKSGLNNAEQSFHVLSDDGMLLYPTWNTHH